MGNICRVCVGVCVFSSCFVQFPDSFSIFEVLWWLRSGLMALVVCMRACVILDIVGSSRGQTGLTSCCTDKAEGFFFIEFASSVNLINLVTSLAY